MNELNSGEWKQIPISLLYSVKYGKANPRKTGSVPVIGSSGIYDWTEKPLVFSPTVVVGRKGSAGQAWLIESPSYPSDTTFYLESRDSIRADIRFTYFALRHLQISASDDVIPSLKRQELESLLIPSPPLAEQQAISAVLWRLQNMMELQEKIITTSKELKAATMAKLFREGLRGEPLKQTEIGEIPESWQVVRLGSHCRITSGGTPRRDVPEYWNGKIAWVKTAEIKYRPITATEECITNAGLTNSSAKLLPKGTLLMAMCGQGVTRGKVAFLQVEAATNQACAALSPDEHLDVGYLYAFCTFAYGRIRELGHGANQRNLSADIIREILLPLPASVEEQKEIYAVVVGIESQLRIRQQQYEKLRLLFDSMLHLLMTGQVRVNNLKLDETLGPCRSLQIDEDSAYRTP